MQVHEKYVTSFDGTPLYSIALGEGPPVILCDGLGCDGFIWRYLKDVLAKKHKVIHWQYRAHGKSGMPSNFANLSMAALEQDLAAVISAYKCDDVRLIGHSLGVQLIFDFAANNPAPVASLVALCGGYGRPLDTLHGHGGWGRIFPRVRDAMRRYPAPTQAVWRRLFKSSVAYHVAARFEINGQVIRRRDFMPYLEHLARMDPQAFVTLLDSLRVHTVEDKLPAIHKPTLIVAGERDTFTPAWLSRRMHSLIQGSELFVVPGGSHVAPIEMPELIAARIEQFLTPPA